MSELTDDERMALTCVVDSLLDSAALDEAQARIRELERIEAASSDLRQRWIIAEAKADAQAVQIRELEDALLDEVHCYQIHRSGRCTPTPMDAPWTWSRDPDCSACQRLERLLGHRRPPGEA